MKAEESRKLKASFQLVLHTHLPYVYHREEEQAIEERWLFEAITESYLPLLLAFEHLEQDQVPFELTMSFTTPLLTMLSSKELQDRYEQYFSQLIQLAEHEWERWQHDSQRSSLLRCYVEHFHALRQYYQQELCKDLIAGFRHWVDKGNLHAITCSASHSFLPYIQTDAARRAQLEVSLEEHERFFGTRPGGIWLPECGYIEGIDALLASLGISYFYTDSHALQHSRPESFSGIYRPIRTPSGVAVFARNPLLSKQVWSSKEGYPGDKDYREYYRDIGFDYPKEELGTMLHPSGIRLNTGLKYYRITGDTSDKQYYDPIAARKKARDHAYHFVSRLQQEALKQQEMDNEDQLKDAPPICITASFDTELFGHWWYEGPIWIEELCRHIHRNDNVTMTTAASYLRQCAPLEVRSLSFSSWGRDGYGDVWLGEDNHWIYRFLHDMELRMMCYAESQRRFNGLEERTLNQMGRELLLAQSSDWAFMIDQQTTVQYATRRLKDHQNRFWELDSMLQTRCIQEERLSELEQLDRLGQSLDYRLYRGSRLRNLTISHFVAKRRVIMLSWEFPPITVGGLSRHVYDLSCELAKQGVEIHIVTSSVQHLPSYEKMKEIHVHRCLTNQKKTIHFMDWVLQLNIEMTERVKALVARGVTFDLIHAHDWMVSYAARMLKQELDLPLIATIHATEHGRNQGIHTELQAKISEQEWRLMYDADRVICCSYFMKSELEKIFQVPAEKVDVVYNGIETSNVQHLNDRSFSSPEWLDTEDQIILFIGRMVREKGVSTLIDSFSHLSSMFPSAKLVVAGKGPMLCEWKEKAKRLKLADRIVFPGFIDDATRNMLLTRAVVCVFPSYYEPFGIVALEAMASRVPVIVSNTGGFREIIHDGQDGLMAEPGNVKDLARALKRMLSSVELRKLLAERGYRKAVSQFDWGHIAKHTLQIYESVIESRHVCGGMER